MYLSIVVPCYNEEDSLSIFHDEIEKTLTDMEYEIIFVNDGSRDSTLDEMKKLADIDSKVKYISFSRNFGKESALYAGLKNAKGNLVCVMDVDLQDPPSLLPQMIGGRGDYDVVATRRVSRKGEPVIRSFFCSYVLPLYQPNFKN